LLVLKLPTAFQGSKAKNTLHYETDSGSKTKAAYNERCRFALKLRFKNAASTVTAQKLMRI